MLFYQINNYHAAYSLAVAEYPNLTVPMGYKNTGEPISLIFIGLKPTIGASVRIRFIHAWICF